MVIFLKYRIHKRIQATVFRVNIIDQNKTSEQIISENSPQHEEIRSLGWRAPRLRVFSSFASISICKGSTGTETASLSHIRTVDACVNYVSGRKLYRKLSIRSGGFRGVHLRMKRRISISVFHNENNNFFEFKIQKEVNKNHIKIKNSKHCFPDLHRPYSK